MADEFFPQFPQKYPTQDAEAIASFQHRARVAKDEGFEGAFPTFYFAQHVRDYVGGTIFVTDKIAKRQDVPWNELGSPPLNNFGERMRATNKWATDHGWVGGFPTCYEADYGKGLVCGAVLLKGADAEWRDVSLLDLGDPPLGDIEARFRGTQEFATRQGFVGGFPNLFDAQKVDITGRRYTVCGTILLKSPSAVWKDVILHQV